MRVCNRISRRPMAVGGHILRAVHILFLLGLLSLLPQAALAQCQGTCPTPNPPPKPNAPATDTDGNYNVTVTNALGSYGYTVWNTGQTSTVNGTTSTLVVSNKPTGTYSYSAKICYIQDNVCSGWSPTATVQVIISVPANPPTTFTVPSTDNDGAFSLSWSTVTGATAYELQERINGGLWATIPNTTLTTKVFSDSSSKVSGTYDYQVRACNSSGCSAYSAVKTTEVVLPPATPSNFHIAETPGNSIYAVIWDATPWAETYTLQERVNNGTWTTIQAGAATSLTISGRAPGNFYSYQVNACHGFSCSPYTSVQTVEVTALDPDTGNTNIPQPLENVSDAVGSVGGVFSVLPSGAASYTIPIEAPPGIGGMAPKLSLSYNSQAGNGFVGIGWTLNGLSAISRCAATLEPDGFNDAADFDSNDRFCLDGKKLILVGSGSYGALNSEYRTEIDGFSRVMAVGGMSGDPASFTVRARTGETMLYGTRSNARIEAQGRTQAMLWALTTITDTAGNKMEFYYDETTANSEYVPTRVEYAFSGGVSRARIEFEYRTQSSPKQYFAGSVVRNTRLLQTVTTYADQAVRDYHLDYETAPGSGHPRLTSLTECSFVSGVCLEPTVFTWQGARNVPVVTALGSRPSGHTPGFNGLHWPLDIDGDGDQELVYNKYGSHEFWYIGSTIEASDGNDNLGTKGHDIGPGGTPLWIMDVNGDGLNDLVYRQIDNGRNYWMLRNRGNGNTLAEELWTDQAVFPSQELSWPMDVNGDGRMDLVYIRNGEYHAVLNQGNGVPATDSIVATRSQQVGLNGAHWVIDVNSDGLPDLVFNEAGTRNFHALINNGNNTFTLRSWTTRGADSGYNYAHWALDANGDGLTDLVYCNAADTREYRVMINKGDGTAEDRVLGTRSQSTLKFDGQHWIGDTNADGVMDLLYKPSSNQVWSLESRADGSRGAVYWGDLYGNDSTDPTLRDRLVELDASGDGQLDLVTASRQDNSYSMLRNTSVPDLLKSVTDGYGNVTDIQYKSLTDGSVYDRTENPYNQYANLTVETPLDVVANVTVSDGVGGTRATGYLYKKLKINSFGRGHLGFAEVDSTDLDAGIRVETQYNQFFPLTGLAASITRCLDTGGTCQSSKTLQKTTYTYATVVTVDGALAQDATFIYPSQTVETMYALDNTTNITSALATITTTNSNPDAYGNIQSITVDTQSLVNTQHYKTTTLNSYSNYTATNSWHLGLLTTSTMTQYLDGATATDANSVRKTAFAYDANTHLLMQETIEPDRAEPFKRITAYARDAYGNITQATVCATDFNNCTPGAAGPSNLPFRTVSTVYDAYGQFPQILTNAAGERESYVYERSSGQKLSLTGPNNLTTRWFYDGFGKILKEIRADTTRTVNTYKWCADDCPQYGRYSVTTESTGSVPVTDYFDTLGRKLRARSVSFDGSAILTDTVYNQLGQVAQVSEPYFEGDTVYWTYSEYDAIDRVVMLTPPLTPAVSTDYNGLTTTMRRTVNGVLRTESETKNIIGRTVNVTNAAGTMLLYGYDSQGNLKTTETAGRADTRITVTHDLLGRKTSMIDPDMGAWSYQYNGYGELISQANALNQVVTLEYDRLGRMVKRTEPEGVSTWVYGNSISLHNVGKLVSVSGPNGLTTKNLEYDSFSRLLNTTTRITVAPYIDQSYQTGQRYDGAGRVETVIYPVVNGGRFQTVNRYNVYGHLEKVTSPTQSTVYWQAQQMNARGQLELVQLGNGVSVANTYRPETGWLDGILVDGENLIYHMSYETDEVGNIQLRTDRRQNLTESFDYDVLDQLTHSSIAGGTASYTAKDYQYDVLGNLSFKTGVGTYQYGSACGSTKPHAVCQAGGSSYIYNANGSLTSGGGRTVSYTSFNLPYQFNTSATFHYDAERLRVFKVTGAVKTAYIGLTDAGNALYEHELHGSLQKHRHFIYAGGKALAVHTIQTGAASGTQTEYLHRDHLGSVEAVSDSAGNAVAYFSYDAWGNPRNANWTDGTVTSNAPGNLGFTGHEMIPEAGLVHMNGRVYDPLLGKFLSADPNVQFEKDVRSYNRYGYVQNNPLKFTDPTGFLRDRVEKWFKKHFGTILNVAATFYPPLQPFAAAYGMMAAVYHGASFGQVMASALVSMAKDELANRMVGESDTTMLFREAVISGAITGGLSGGINAMIMGTKISRGILQGMATGAATAAVIWKVSQSPAENTRQDTTARRRLPDGGRVVGQVAGPEDTLFLSDNQEGQVKNETDLKFTYGLQGGGRVGLTKILGAQIEVDFGSREVSLITGKEYVNENYTVGADVLGFSLGIDASRNTEIREFRRGIDSIQGILSGREFDFKPIFQTPWGVSASELWKIDIGVSFGLGLEGKLDFGVEGK